MAVDVKNCNLNVVKLLPRFFTHVQRAKTQDYMLKPMVNTYPQALDQVNLVAHNVVYAQPARVIAANYPFLNASPMNAGHFPISHSHEYVTPTNLNLPLHESPQIIPIVSQTE